ncbi:ABC transporter ATP-binding protein [Actinoallomurus iriomotensis]|uniref:Sugar ABC transporter ATP-binding protein n=1 Tax=Actinoallomurus iriomotensis TaxID=478107 RepID=A0A9W6SEW1_9ACTN|nr:ABC transporter ATP-binding protein [Actinoallomurus iriomotensis]GLY90957.1 sugar ABC transporter ATP-binding protein [Actinoallomurus iriomotensis]
MKVSLEEVTKVFDGGVTALDALSLEIQDGEFFALLGPSGCGKTTLLRTIAGLETASSGTLRIGDRDVTRVPPGARDVAMVFQDYALFPHMTVADNIAYPLRIKKVGRAERRAKAAATGEGLSLGGLMERRPAQLSGGQQQRVALARAMAAQPTVFLLDEPLSNLDARLRLEARTFLKKLQHDLGVTTVFVTHDQAEALALADRIAVMESGRIRQLGTPREVFQRPANVFVAGFIGSTPMNLLAGECVPGDGETATSWGHQIDVAGVRLPVPEDIVTELTPGDKVIVGIRPEYLTESEDGIKGTVEIVENLGTTSLVTLTTTGPSVQLTVPEGREPEPGATLHVTPAPGRLLVYRADDGELIDAP